MNLTKIVTFIQFPVACLNKHSRFSPLIYITLIIIICELLTDRDNITESETQKDCLDGVNKTIVASTNKPNKIKRAPGVETTVLPPEVDNCSSDVSMEVDKGKVCVLLFLFSYSFHQVLFSGDES